jgi:hypothetical protein
VNEKGFKEMLEYFSKARDAYDRKGMKQYAQRCEDAIATAQSVEVARITGIISFSD